MLRVLTPATWIACCCCLLVASTAVASSHREAPAILSSPQVDGTDFYMFRSYETGRSGFVTLIANYNPLQDPYGGPNYFPLDSEGVYDIHVANNGDAVEDITFRFRFSSQIRGLSLNVGPDGQQETVPVALTNIGPIGPGFGIENANENRFFTLQMLRGPVDAPTEVVNINNPRSGGRLFGMPLDNIGTKSFTNYQMYANAYIFDVNIPGCGASRVFAGQRKESFSVNLGEVFDLVNTNPVGPRDGEPSVTANKNITSLILELPISCLTASSPVIGGWTTARLPRTRTLLDRPSQEASKESAGGEVQVSRLGSPLVNELVIGLPDKNRFNSSKPQDDPQFLSYVTNPTFPELLEALFGVTAPNAFPRNDLVQVFLTGIPGLNEDGSVGEFLRLNTSIDPVPRDQQDSLGVLSGDLAGFPNGRRPGDDATDITLRAAMGVLLDPADAPSGLLPYTDGALQSAGQFLDAFPYLRTPLAGSPLGNP